MSETIPLSQRLPKALIWFALGALAFYLIGFVWKAERDAIRDWPIVEAQVQETSLARELSAQGVSRYGYLTVVVRYRDSTGQPRLAKRLYTGTYHGLEARAEEDFSKGTELKVRIDPQDPGKYELAQFTTWGMWVMAFFAAMFFIINGMTVLNRHTPMEPDTE